MLIYLASFMNDRTQSPVVAAFQHLAATADLRGHQLTDDPETADCVLFVDLHLCPDPLLQTLLRHPLLRRFEGRSLVYDERDEPWCALPGVYVSMPATHFDARRQRAFGYYASVAGTMIATPAEPDLLFSFMGSPGHHTSGGHAVRQALLTLRDSRAVIEDSSGFVFYDDKGDADAHRARQRRFAEVMHRSKFVLCPRGRGTSSIRMYEALRAGRVPVVLADDWVAPVGPNWEACSIKIREVDAATVADVIAANEPRWQEMSTAARAAYDTWFSPTVGLGRLFDLCEPLVNDYPVPTPRWRDAGYRAMRRRAVVQKSRALAGKTLRAVGLK